MSFSPRHPLRLMTVDDHQVVRMGLRLLEQEHDWVRVVGEAATAEEAVRLASWLRPDAIILDIRLAGASGLDVCRLLKQRQPGVKILRLTSYLSDALIIEAIDAGADGYLLKECDAGEIVRALETIMRGGVAMSPELSRRALQGRGAAPKRDENGWVKEVTPQELRILAALAAGQTNKEIAERMALSPMTVRNYLERVFLKLDVQRRSAAAVCYSRALAAGLLKNLPGADAAGLSLDDGEGP